MSTITAEKVKVTKFEILPLDGYKAIQVQEDNQLHVDGKPISTGNYHRYVIIPTDDLTAESDEVVAIANAVFTQDMKDAYTASQETAE